MAVREDRLKLGEKQFGEVRNPHESEDGIRLGYIEKTGDGKIELTIFYPRAEFFEMTGGFGGFQSDRKSSHFFLFAGDAGDWAFYRCYITAWSLHTSRDLSRITYRVGHAVRNLRNIPNNGGAGTVRAEISGLFNWIGKTAIKEPYPGSEATQHVQVETVNNEPIEIDRSATSKRMLRADWFINLSSTPVHRGKQVAIRSLGLFQIESIMETPWRANILDALMLRDLLSISSWQPQELLQCEVTFDLLSSLDSASCSRQWHQIDGLEQLSGEPVGESPSHHLYRFQHIGVDGVKKWFELCQNWRTRRTVETLDSLLRLKLPLQRRVQLLGGAIDGLYHYCFDGQPSFREECQIIRKKLDPILPQSEFEDWGTRMSKAYNASKHAERESAGEEFEEFKAYHEGLFIVRLFLGQLLGAENDELRQLKPNDPCNPSHYEYSTIRDPLDEWQARNR